MSRTIDVDTFNSQTPEILIVAHADGSLTYSPAHAHIDRTATAIRWTLIGADECTLTFNSDPVSSTPPPLEVKDPRRQVEIGDTKSSGGRADGSPSILVKLKPPATGRTYSYAVEARLRKNGTTAVLAKDPHCPNYDY